jgi:hypothetical protein
MKQEGPRLGYRQYADAISVNASGDYYIADPKARTEILNLREDPQIAADLAAAFTASNGAYLAERFGRMPSPGELYIAHFLGAQGAEKMFTAGLADPDQSAVALFPRQARANPSIFYSGGEPRTVRDVYRALIAKHAPPPTQDAAFAAQQLAAATTAQPATVSPLAIQPLGYASGELPLSTGLQPLLPTVGPQATTAFAPAVLSFEGLFSTGPAAPANTEGRATPTSSFFAHLYGQ